MSDKSIKLFAVYLGGRAAGCHIELHDVVFVAGKSIDDTHERLQSLWFGLPERLHIDSYMALSQVDGYDITLSKQTPDSDDVKLFFINYGAYFPEQFGETHEMTFFVEKAKVDARKRAHKQLCLDLDLRHVDDNRLVTDILDTSGAYAVDDIMELNQVDGYYLHFAKSDTNKPNIAKPGYIKVKAKKEAV